MFRDSNGTEHGMTDYLVVKLLFVLFGVLVGLGIAGLVWSMNDNTFESKVDNIKEKRIDKWVVGANGQKWKEGCDCDDCKRKRSMPNISTP